MNYKDHPPEAQRIIDVVWKHFTRELEWPPLKVVLRSCKEVGLEFKSEAIDGMNVNTHTSSSVVSLSFDLILTVPGVRELLEPVPQMFRLAAQRFIGQPAFANEPNGPEVNHNDFANIWNEPSQTELVRKLIDMSPWRCWRSSSSGPSGFSYSCSIEALMYEHVQTLDEMPAVHICYPGWPRDQSPSGPHLQLLEAVYQYALSQGVWPQALQFAIDHRNIGYIPHLAADMGGSYLVDGFGTSRHNRISLSIWALPLVDSTGEVKNRFVKTVKAIYDLWEQSPEESVRITLTDLSRSLQLPPSEAILPALFIQSERLWSGGNFNTDAREWSISTEHQLIFHFKDIESWDDYIKIRKKLHGAPAHLREPLPALRIPENLSAHLVRLAPIAGNLYGILSDTFTQKERQSPRQFMRDHLVDMEEDQHTEFKEVKGKDPAKIIANAADEYAVGFLNSEGGSVYWGVDDNCKIVGVKITSNDRNEIRKLVNGKLQKIAPGVGLDLFSLRFYPVVDASGEHLDDLYVVELRVDKPARLHDLYCTEGHEVYMRQNGTTNKLTPSQIQDWTRRHHSNGSK